MPRASLKILVSNTIRDNECGTWDWHPTRPRERRLLYFGPLNGLHDMPGIGYDLLMISRDYFTKLMNDNDNEPV